MKIALINPDAFTVWQFRRGLIKTLLKLGAEVHVISVADAFTERVKALGVTFHPAEFSRFISPIQDISYLLKLYRLFRAERFDLVHNFTVKPNTYGAIAAKLSGVPHVVATVEGLGFSFSIATTIKDRVLKQLVMLLSRVAFSLSNRVWFLNKDDLVRLVEQRIVSESKSVLIRSIGVNLEEYSTASIDKRKMNDLRAEFAAEPNTILVSMIISRLVWSKGVNDFVKAAHLLLPEHPHVHFILVGPVDDTSPDAVPFEYLYNKLPPNLIWSDFREDVKEILAISDLIVLPSYYGEGVPRILLEGLAMGKTIITTNNVGCREVVENGKNGYLIPIKDPDALKDAISSLLYDEVKRANFGKYSRAKAENEFDEALVNRRVVAELYGMAGDPPTNAA